jgi:hypothetical protein
MPMSPFDKYAPKTTYDDGVLAGYKAICNTTASKIFNSPTRLVLIDFTTVDSASIHVGNGVIDVCQEFGIIL